MIALQDSCFVIKYKVKKLITTVQMAVKKISLIAQQHIPCDELVSESLRIR